MVCLLKFQFATGGEIINLKSPNGPMHVNVFCSASHHQQQLKEFFHFSTIGFQADSHTLWKIISKLQLCYNITEILDRTLKVFLKGIIG